MLATYIVYFFMYLNETRKYDINVTALVRNEKKAWEKFEDFRDMPYFHLKVQDVCTPITMEEKPEYIIHAAGNASRILFYMIRSESLPQIQQGR